MTSINIRRDVKDSFYRYKMPRLISKIEGKGNGIKTVIPNMSDIARALSRPPTYTTKYFGFELGAQTKCDAKTDRYIVNGAHDAEKLQNSLDGFITRFVLCGECQNPETDLIVQGKGEIIRNCKACGKRTGVDGRHKLAAFIVKNPPPPVNDNYTKKKKENDAIANGKSDEEDDSEADEALTKRIQAEAAQLKDAANSDDDDWAEDTSEEAQAARMRELQEGLNAKLVLGDEDEDDEEESGGKYEKFGTWLEQHVDSATDAEIMSKATDLGLEGKHRLVQVIVQVIFDDKITQQIKKRVPLLRKFVTNEKAQKSLLGGLERVLGMAHRSALSKTPIVLKALYDADLVDEAVMLKWGSKPSKRYVTKDISKEVKKAAEPFINWLKEAEEETSEEESD